MHVLYFHQHFSTPRGATGTRSYQMAQALIQSGHEVTMVCGSYDLGHTGLSGEPVNGYRRGVVDGIHVIEIALPYSNRDRFGRRAMSFLRFALRSIGIALQTRYDVLLATSTPLTAGIPGIAMRLFKPRRPFVFEVRDLWPELPRAMGVIRNPLVLGAMSLLEGATYSCANACIGLSPGIVEGIRRRCAPGKPVEMVPNGCDLELFHARGSPRADRTFRAVFTGAHGMANGLGSVLDAAAVLRERRREDIEIHFIGEGRVKGELQRDAAERGLANCVFHDPMSKDALAEILQEFDVGLMVLADVPAFYFGTSPNKFFDYIAAGLPVINNYPGWLAQLIAQHQCGLAVPAGKPELFADALIKLADEPSLRSEMGRNARKLAEKCFDRAHLAAQWVSVLESVHAGRKTEHRSRHGQRLVVR